MSMPRPPERGADSPGMAAERREDRTVVQQRPPDVIDRLAVQHDGLDLLDRRSPTSSSFRRKASTLQPTRAGSSPPAGAAGRTRDERSVQDEREMRIQSVRVFCHPVPVAPGHVPGASFPLQGNAMRHAGRLSNKKRRDLRLSFDSASGSRYQLNTLSRSSSLTAKTTLWARTFRS